MEQEYKARFIKLYSDLPLKVRKEVISVVDDEPITWNAAYIEIMNETILGEKVLKNLISYDIL